MANGSCPHCGQSHPSDIEFCPLTGKAVQAAPSSRGLPMPDGRVPPPPPPSSSTAAPSSSSSERPSAPMNTPPVDAEGKSVLTLLNEAFDLYRTHAKALLLTCALLFVPASLVKSCALSAVLAPSITAAAYMSETAALGQKSAEASRRAFSESMKNGKLDPAAVEEFSRQNARNLEELSRKSVAATGAVLGGFSLFMLGLLGNLITAFFFYGIVVPLTNGALTISVADRILGGSAGWREVWMLLFRRLGLLLSAVLPAALLVAVGFVAFVIPGIILAVLFTFVSPVVLIEGVGGRAALKRSATLVRQDWMRVVVVSIVFAVVTWFAQFLANLFIPSSAVFIWSFFGDLFALILMPVPVLGAVLLYFDMRRTREGFSQDRLRADLTALKS